MRPNRERPPELEVVVGRVGCDPPRVEGRDEWWNVRVDRGTALGNPYMMGCEADREPVCAAYDLLMACTMGHGPVRSPHSGRTLVTIGRMCGFYGTIAPWGFNAVRARMGELRQAAWSGRPLCLQCHCYPRQCHAETIFRWL